MFFSSDIPIADVVKTIRENDPIKQFSLLLRAELQNFDFCIDNSFKSAKDIILALRYIRIAFYQNWKKFIKHLPGFRKGLHQFDRHSSTVFQIIYYMMHSGK